MIAYFVRAWGGRLEGGSSRVFRRLHMLLVMALLFFGVCIACVQFACGMRWWCFQIGFEGCYGAWSSCFGCVTWATQHASCMEQLVGLWCMWCRLGAVAAKYYCSIPCSIPKRLGFAPVPLQLYAAALLGGLLKPYYGHDIALCLARMCMDGYKAITERYCPAADERGAGAST